MPDDWLTLPAGDELNALVWERVFGFQSVTRGELRASGHDEAEAAEPLPFFSQHIEDAWAVWERLPLQRWIHEKDDGVFVFCGGKTGDECSAEAWGHSEVGAVPLAICRCALAWAEAQEKSDA